MAEEQRSREEDYSSEDIKVLEGLSAVRKRPGMYIGSTGPRGLHHLVYEVMDNSIDEAMAGHCDKIEVVLHEDNSVTVRDNGRGIPVEKHKKYDKSGVEVVMTKLHAGGKFDDKTYQVSGGLHGVGVSVVNALSEKMEVTVKRNNKVYKQEFRRGEVEGELEVVGETEESGTEITFLPDKEIFKETREQDYEVLSTRFKELAFLNQGLTITIKDERGEEVTEEEYKYEGGIKSFVEYLNNSKKPLHDPVYLEKEENGIKLEVALQYSDSFQEAIFTFVNNINTHEGGTHLSGFKTALTRTLNKYGEEYNLLPDDVRIKSKDSREGLAGIISINLKDPQFEGQTKTKLGNSKVRGIVTKMVGRGLSTFLEETPDTAEVILEKVVSAAKSRIAAKKAREVVRRKSALESTTLPGKLVDCSNQDPEDSELYIVEGDSAGGSAKQGRDKEFQAILPLRGKILNVEKARLDKIIENKEISSLISALGCGIGDEFDIDNLRYNKIIIMTDSDVDGSHITTLILTFFFRYMKELIDQGHLYIAQSPLFLVKKGRSKRYALDKEEKEKIVEEMGSRGLKVQRYKGLGEMNPKQLWETTMNPENRVLKKVTIEDAVYADKIFTTLMGEQVAPRKEFIEEHAKEAVNLDV